jgi:phosphatidylethanolamine-binding protein (PEBP) family uncharacterized protein
VTLLGRLLHNRRAGDAHTAWNLPNLQAQGPKSPDLLTVTSQHFADGATMALEQCAKAIGGADLSPQITWSALPPGTAQLLLVVEDIDVPLSKPGVHCLALIDPAVGQLEPGALNARQPGTGVQLMRSTVGRGYHGPAPIKGHGPHHYVFELFALATLVAPQPRARPRVFLPAVTASVLGRGRLTGVYER